MNTDSQFEDATIPAIANSEAPPATTATRVPDSFGHYLLDRRADGSLWQLGRGGMGVTYKATDVNLRCEVALKIIGPQCFGGESSRHRFVREARLAAQIRHPNVAAVHHLESEGDEIFYAMEFVDGITAEEWVRGRGAMSPELALDVAMQVSRALTAADRLELVHRDIKPGNIMLLADPADSTRVIVKVIDFGLARSGLFESSPVVTTCAFVGTPQYASPEHIENAKVDIRSDIYALGCVLWYLLTGEPPFSGSHARVMAHHLTAEPPFARLDHLPKPIVSLARRMLAKDPEDRPRTPVALHALICECRASLPAQRNEGGRHGFGSFFRKRSAALRPSRRAILWALSLAGFAAFAWIELSPSETRTNPELQTATQPGVITASTAAGEAPTISANPAPRSEAVQPVSNPTSPEDIPPQVPGLNEKAPSPDSPAPEPLKTADTQETSGVPEPRPDPAVSSQVAGPGTTPDTKPDPKPASHSRKSSGDHRSSVPEPLQRVQRTIRSFVNRIF